MPVSKLRRKACKSHHHNEQRALANLPFNQKNTVRHVCAGCAYKKGYQAGYEAAFAKIQDLASGVDPESPDWEEPEEEDEDEDE